MTSWALFEVDWCLDHDLFLYESYHVYGYML
ncbi:unnamed protein product [Spirodela intermedia]|uniref:Uncharacterized protein n=1 Tax=Spirodela intermedia TaxID=51605 RepID=A0A7I8JCS7_SPIIN|nr:unnamed protein product [Spirodela intermedia]CAA6667313.1 unnamed protein product [Spirodela intermedia]